MPFLKAANDCDQIAHYSIYVYHNSRKKKAKSPWEMKGVTHDLDEALEHAYAFYATRQFRKVEVKKRIYDTVNAQSQDMTIKTYEAVNRDKINVFAASAMLMAALILMVGTFMTK